MNGRSAGRTVAGMTILNDIQRLNRSLTIGAEYLALHRPEAGSRSAER
jgi:hypothetical protein